MPHAAEDIARARPYLAAVDRTVRLPAIAKFELTSFFAQPNALQQFSADVIKFFGAGSAKEDGSNPVDAWIGLDALGLIVGGALSGMSGLPMISARKEGKLSVPQDNVVRTKLTRTFLMGTKDEYEVAEMGDKKLEIRKDLLTKGMKVVVV